LRGGEGCRMAVPEPDDRDPGAEVEVAAAVLAVEPGALAARQRDAVARIGREDGCFQDRAHVTTAGSPISALTPSRAAVTAARSRVANEPELRNRPRTHPDLVAEQWHGERAELRAQRRGDALERLADDLERRGRCHAPAADELHGQAEPRHLFRNLGPGAVHD